MRLWRVAAIVSSILLAGLPASFADDARAPAEGGPAKWTPKDGDEIRFKVLRKGSPFGTHVVTFDVDPDGTLKATTRVKLKAGLGPITVFNYDLAATETWKDGELVALKGKVNDDGRKGDVVATRDGDELVVDGTIFDGAVPESILPASHWNEAQTDAHRLLSTEDGRLIKVDVIDKGPEDVLAGGQVIRANKYLMDSDIDVTLWYDDAGRWVKLAFSARGQDIEYVLDQAY